MSADIDWKNTDPGTKHFCNLLNILVNDINLSAVPDINSAWDIVIYKGHGKPRTSQSAYRCISTCTILCKGLDLWVTKLQQQNWKNVKSKSQFMTSGSSHELASLYFTEIVRYNTITLNKPVWALLADKQTAFDSTLKEFVIPAAFHAMSSNNQEIDQSLVYLANRLANRHTYNMHMK